MKRSKLSTKIIIFALIVYAGVSLLSLRGRIETQKQNISELRREVAEKEITNAELSYEVEHYDDANVKERIARSRLGLASQGETVFYDVSIIQGSAD